MGVMGSGVESASCCDMISLNEAAWPDVDDPEPRLECRKMKMWMGLLGFEPC